MTRLLGQTGSMRPSGGIPDDPPDTARGEAAGEAMGETEQIDVSVARELWRAGDTFVDVRTPEEYARGHVRGAINVPLDRIPFVADSLPPGQVVTVCSTGQRSWRGAEAFARRGRTALSLRGGTKAWQAARLPVETGEDRGLRSDG